MKKVLLKIYPEFNLGDDLFLKSVLERYPNNKFYVEAPVEYIEKFTNKYENLIIFNNKKVDSFLLKVCLFMLRKMSPTVYRKWLIERIKNRHINIIDNCNVFVSIGGSIFIEPKKMPYYFDIEYYNYMNSVFRDKFIIGANFGPYVSHDYLNSYCKIFSNFTDVCFRDKKSFDLFANEVSSVRYSPDVVLGLDMGMDFTRINKSVGFSVISNRGLISNEEYIMKYKSLVQFYLELGYKVYLFSFCAKEGDESVISMILKDKFEDNPNVYSVFYNGDIEYFLDIYKKVEFMYCSRFHSVILSMKFKQYIYPIIYSDKTIAVLEDLNYSGKIVKLSEFSAKENIDYHSDIKTNSYNIERYVEQAKSQFTALDKLLGGSI